MKILYINDTQFRGKNPINRRDNYYNSLKEKFIEILEIGKKEKVDMFLHGGDFFDHELISLTICDELIDLIESYNIPFYIVAGNHDEANNNWSVSKATTLAHMFRRSNIIKELIEFENDEVYIKGMHFFVGIEDDIRKGIEHNINNKFTIFVPHAMIVDSEVNFMSCIDYRKLNTNYDMVCVSHNHKQWGIQEHNETVFVAPGAIARSDASTQDFKRIPSIALINTSTKKVELIQLKSAKKVEDIFDLEKLAASKESSEKLKAFINGLKDVKVQSLNVLDTIKSVCDEGKVSDDIWNNLKERISLNG